MKTALSIMTALGCLGLFLLAGCDENRGMSTTNIYYITQVSPDQQAGETSPADDGYFYVNENGQVVEGNATDQADWAAATENEDGEPNVVYIVQEAPPEVVVVDNPYPVYTTGNSWVGVTFGGVYDYGCYPYWWPYPCYRQGYDRYRPYDKRHHPRHGGGIREKVVYYDKAGNRLTPPRSPYVKNASVTPRRDRYPTAKSSGIGARIGGVRIGNADVLRRLGSQGRSPAADRLTGNVVYYTPAGDRVTPTVRSGSRRTSYTGYSGASGGRINTLPRGGVITGGSYPTTGGMRPGSGGVDTSGRSAGSSRSSGGRR